MAEIRFTKHALEKLYERRVTPDECEATIHRGMTIERYPDDKPFPSELKMARVGDKTLHVVVAFGPDTMHVITAYEPDCERWEEGFTKRRTR
jgi:hypothetical protein